MKVTTIFLISVALLGIAAWIVTRSSAIAPERPKLDPVPRWWHAISFAAAVPICGFRGWEHLMEGRFGTLSFWGFFCGLTLVMAVWEASDFRREGAFAWPSGRDRPDGIIMILFPFALAWEIEPAQARLWAMVAGLIAAVVSFATMATGRRAPPSA
jgi:hypothetical protein